MGRIKDTPIMVDKFQQEKGVHIYICTHLHTDHTSGLCPSWNNGIIYCSKLTRCLLLDKFQVNPKLVVGLDTDQTYKIKMYGDIHLQLSMIDANHCPGSVMLIMEGYFGSILHTGDFRFHENQINHPLVKGKKFDRLYLDDTFCNPAYDFPSREVAGKEILDIVEKYPNHRICVATDTLGKEELLVAIAMKCKSFVVVDSERFRQLQLMKKEVDLPDVFTMDENGGRIFCLSKRSINFHSMSKMNLERPTVGILPSGWSSKILQKSKKQDDITRILVWKVGYSLHSSFSELKQFVKAIQPKTLHSASLHNNPLLRQYFFDLCSRECPKPYQIPPALQEYMSIKQCPITPMKAKTSGIFVNYIRNSNEHKISQGAVIVPSLQKKVGSTPEKPLVISSEENTMGQTPDKAFVIVESSVSIVETILDTGSDANGRFSRHPRNLFQPFQRCAVQNVRHISEIEQLQEAISECNSDEDDLDDILAAFSDDEQSSPRHPTNEKERKRKRENFVEQPLKKRKMITIT